MINIPESQIMQHVLYMASRVNIYDQSMLTDLTACGILFHTNLALVLKTNKTETFMIICCTCYTANK